MSRWMAFLAVLLLALPAWAASTEVVSVTLGSANVGNVNIEPGSHTLTVTVRGQVIYQDEVEVPAPSKHLVFSEDTTITEPLTLRAGDSIELRNGARLTIAAPYDWQGTPTPTWSWDGSDPASLSYTIDRDIDIFGQGDILFASGSGAGVIRYVEIDVQPKFSTGHYPLHWHMLGDESRGTLVEGVVVKNSTFRAYVPHASHGITFRDVIAQNITGEAFWWDRPGSNQTCSFLRFCTADNTNDTTVERLLVDGVTQFPTDSRGYTLNAVTLGAGAGNSVTDSFVQGVNPTHIKDCSAYHWPESANQNAGGTVWGFTNNYGASRCHGIFVWQNDDRQHLIDGFSGGGIDHGAYTNLYVYRNLDVPYFEVHARSPIVEDSIIPTVIGQPHRLSGSATFNRVQVDTLIVQDAAGQGAMAYRFNDSTLTCNDVQWSNPHPSSTVWVDGVQCERN